MRTIIVDGYNVIRADAVLQSLEARSLELARTSLVQMLKSSPRLIHDEIVVVFDGRLGSHDRTHQYRSGRLTTMYSARGQTADDVIVEYVESLAGRSVVVVTNDVAVRENSRALGAEVSGSENLLAQMPGRNRRPARNVEAARDDASVPRISTRKRGNPRRTQRKRSDNDLRF